MGIFDALQQRLGVRNREAQVLLVGLDNSGKTTVLRQLKPQLATTAVSDSLQSVGFTVSQIHGPQLTITVMDMSGQSRHRDLWQLHYKASDGIVFVVDCADRMRLAVAKQELDQLLVHDDVRDGRAPILVLANKTDDQMALGVTEISQLLGLDDIRRHSWQICATCALTGDGLKGAFEWLSREILEQLKTCRR